MPIAISESIFGERWARLLKPTVKNLRPISIIGVHRANSTKAAMLLCQLKTIESMAIEKRGAQNRAERRKTLLRVGVSSAERSKE
ncbi:MAG: hypothetical protein LBP51_05575, partial [Deferribacteraceae bacterium]|nr:hypothetical protein [Deferribacteraceae bacterium]